MCKYSWVSFNGPDSDTHISRFEHLVRGTSRHPKINVIGKAQKKMSRSDILHIRQGTSSFIYLWRKMLDTYFFSVPRPHTSAFKGLCTAFDLKQNPDKTPNLVAALCFLSFSNYPYSLTTWPGLNRRFSTSVLSGHFCTVLAPLWHFWKKWWYRKSWEQSPEE